MDFDKRFKHNCDIYSFIIVSLHINSKKMIDVSSNVPVLSENHIAQIYKFDLISVPKAS